ncbi:baseplate spike [Alteromonas phage vB_AmeM_PT11-V22]|uniref:Baseplate protein n=1 Tax=Alteromonas phage vB_AmeM_PT11-V22 TaxID=2704031 RepID=A0A6C0R2L7_9CAUD|nr:baseplate spike [Alteromonas phage vB_AmeM_PT11-V22]QHZ59744.1 baseplate protein [Alteromonas phage vB_AmeM_PT11-V22]
MINLTEVIQSHINKAMFNLNTCVPAYITEVVEKGDFIKEVSVRIVNQKSYKSGEIFERNEITNVPILFPSSSEGIVSFPVKVGDTVLLLFSQEDVDTFLHDGTKDKPPQSFRKFSLTDAIAVPCVHPTNSDIKAHKDNFQITFNDFKLSVKPSGETSLETNTSVSTNAQNLIESVTGRYKVDSSITEVTSDTVTIGNGSVDIVQYLSDLTEEISNITVGGTPIDNKAKFTELKALIDELK